ncbi:MAG: energy-coupling factor ABC transporter permease [Muribaculaceae bacterium]|nr:energy-coupling factor ABC transporter permease [Muribaculaceae bacterium]
MHASDALMSPMVASIAGVVSAVLIGVSSNKIKSEHRQDIVPLMGVMGAFVFAAQMINFTIPGTGSSGHLIGGILLSALMGPWCGFITLCSILIIQCLIFADGGLMALGCNILNMAATSCLIAYPLLYKPIAGKSQKPGRIVAAAIISSIFALELGAFGVTLETELSGVTLLPFSKFLTFMLPIHFVIGAIEGIVTSALILFIFRYRKSMLQSHIEKETKENKGSLKMVLLVFGIFALILGGAFSILASEFPDGLEWAIMKVTGDAMMEAETPAMAIMPDYDSNFAGIIGSIIVMIFLWGISSLLLNRFRKPVKER